MVGFIQSNYVSRSCRVAAVGHRLPDYRDLADRRLSEVEQPLILTPSELLYAARIERCNNLLGGRSEFFRSEARWPFIKLGDTICYLVPRSF